MNIHQDYHITAIKLEQEMKAQTLAKRIVIPHEETSQTMKQSPQEALRNFLQTKNNSQVEAKNKASENLLLVQIQVMKNK